MGSSTDWGRRRRSLGWMIIAWMAILTVPGDALSGDCIDYSEFLHWVGGVNTSGPEDVAVAGPYAYVTGGHYGLGLQVIDVSNPTSPMVVGSVETPGDAIGVAVQGTYAYVADGDLQVVDVSNGSGPFIVGSVDTPGGAGTVAVAGSLACIVGGTGLQVIDISNPASPAIVGAVAMTYATDVAMQGEYAFVADDHGLQVVDISDPTSPGTVGSLDVDARGIAVDGTYAYLCDDEVVTIVDISNPTSPTIVWSGEVSIAWDAVTVEGNFLYLVGQHGSDNGGLVILDISYPPAPEYVGSLPMGGASFRSRVAVDGAHAYISTNGLEIVDVSNPFPPPVVGRLPGLGDGFAVAVAGTLACIGDNGRLLVVDISNPSSPMTIGLIDIPAPDGVDGVAMMGGYAYVADRVLGLTVVDITDPTFPRIVGSVDTPGQARGVAVSGSYAYVADGTFGLQVIDISDPASPEIVGDAPGSASYDVDVEGRYAYVVGSTLLVIDISIPEDPAVVGTADVVGSAIAVAGSYAYVGGGRLYVIDVSNPINPTVAGSARGDVGDVAVTGSHVYSTEGSGLQVFDVTNPAFPAITGGGTGLCFPYGFGIAVAVDGRYAYTTQTDCNLAILPLQCERPSAVELSSLVATPSPTGISLGWSTSFEFDHLGFHIHRSALADRDYVRLTTVPIEPPGPYRFMDTEVIAGTTFYYRIEAIGSNGEREFFGPVSARFDVNRLSQNRPNPFPPGSPAEIRFNVAETTPATLRIFDAAGRLVRILLDERLEAGAHAVAWDGRNEDGAEVGSGIYFYRLDAGEFSATRELVRLR